MSTATQATSSVADQLRRIADLIEEQPELSPNLVAVEFAFGNVAQIALLLNNHTALRRLFPQADLIVSDSATLTRRRWFANGIEYRSFEPKG